MRDLRVALIIALIANVGASGIFLILAALVAPGRVVILQLG